MASQLGDLGLVLTSPTVLTAGLNCSNATPCNARLGNNVFSVTNSSTITLTAGSGTLYLYLDASGIALGGAQSFVDLQRRLRRIGRYHGIPDGLDSTVHMDGYERRVGQQRGE